MAPKSTIPYTRVNADMNDHARDDLLGELRDLPTYPPSTALRREVRVAALGRLAQQKPQTRWQRFFQHLAIPLALSAMSVLYLLRAAADTPLLR